MQLPVNLTSLKQRLPMTRVRLERTTYGLKVPDTARTYSSNLVSTECDRSQGLSVHVPKRPIRNALACQILVRESVTAQKCFCGFPPATEIR